ncbi:MAG: DegV family protein, partial [Thermodesulfobacteriota bacterium]|nr:DegV family protein [Thermodesulfobacteriota bacterium]
MSIISRAAADGYGCLSSWADLLDRINVFPVPDSDTGTNLRISLAPLQQPDITPTDLPGLLARSATGNSGNIAAAFLQDFLQAKNSNQLTTAAISGRDKSRQAVLDPKRGTMLDIFDTLAMTLTKQPPPDATGFLPLCKQLQNAVLATSDLLPELKTAGVVDSGALGMFIFLEGFFKTITAFQGATPSVSHRFKDKLTIVPTWSPIPSTSHCIDALLDTAGDQSGGTVRELTALGDSVVVSNDNSKLKIHLHTSNPRRVQDYLTSMGALIHWHDEDMAVQTQQPILIDRPVHIMTDAAGSLDRETAKRQNITLLDSYIIAGDQSCPESLCPPRQIYERMSRGERISTAQASTFERHQHYVSAIQQYKKVLYLCVGSVYTGNCFGRSVERCYPP